MKTGKKGIDLIFYFETGGNLKKYLTAYWDATGKVWTIGIGSTYYEDGSLIKKGDVITEDRARKLFANILPRYEKELNYWLDKYNIKVNQNQFDALMSFGYNVGVGNEKTAKLPARGLAGSTLFKKMKINPNDPTIRDEFPKWNKSGGMVLKGLTRRRIAEANLYFEK